MAKTFPIMHLANHEINQLREAGALFAVVGVPWDLIAKHERQADRNHGQTIARLAERGGLSACEAVAVLEDRRYQRMTDAAAHTRLAEIIRAALVDAAIEATRSPAAVDQVDLQVEQKIEQGRAFVRQVEADLGHPLTDHIVDLFCDNANKLGFSDVDCLTVGNAIRADKKLPPIAKWWSDRPLVDATVIALPPAPVAAAPRPRKFIVARSLRDAASTAEIDWKWHRVRDGWIDAAGDLVRYCGRDRNLCGYAPGTVIYLGYAWYDEHRRLRDYAAAARFELLSFADALKAGPSPTGQGEG